MEGNPPKNCAYSLEHIDIMYENNPFIVFLMDLDMNVLECNKTAIRYFGFDSRDSFLAGIIPLLNESIPPIQPTGRKSIPLRERLKAAMRDGLHHFESELHLHGEPTLFDITIKFVPHQKSRIFYCHMKEQDGTGKRLRLMLNTTPIACVFMDMDGSMLDCNMEAVRLFESESKEAFLDNFWAMVPIMLPNGQNGRVMLLNMLDRVFLQGRAEFEFIYHLPSEAVLPAEVTMVRVNSNGSSNIMMYVRDMRVLEAAKYELYRHSTLLQSVNAVSVKLISAPAETVGRAVTESLEMLGKAVEADRAYIWELFEKDGKTHTRQVYEWSGGAEPQQGKDFTLCTPLEMLPVMSEMFSTGKIINGPVSELLGGYGSKLMEAQGIISIIMIPIKIRGTIWGFIGFDDCHSVRTFTQSEEQLLRSGGVLMVSSLTAAEATLTMLRHDRLRSAVNKSSLLLMNDAVSESFVYSVSEALRILGECTDANVISVWRCFENEEGKLSCGRYAGYDFENGLSIKPSEALYAFETYIPEWLEAPRKEINTVSGELTESFRKLPFIEGCKSLLLLPINVQGRFWGFVGLTHCKKEYIYTEAELDILRAGGMLVASAITRMEITQSLVEAHNSAERSRESLQTVLDTLPVPVRLLDIETSTFTYQNPSCRELFGIEPSESAKMCIYDTMPEFQTNGTPSADIVQYIKDSENMFSLEVDYVTTDGKLLNTLLTSTKINYNGRATAVGIIRNLATERREAELRAAARAAEEASRAKSNFLAHMSHEIRTPINSIVGFTELALDSRPSPQVSDYLSKIRYSSEVLLATINDILDISKIEAGKIILEEIPFSITDLFASCRTLIAPKAEEKGIGLYCLAASTDGKMILGDPTRLQQVLLNLLSNAVKFTNAGTVEMVSEIPESGEDSVVVRFGVKDTGIGMSAEKLRQIYEPFVQADSSTTREYGGTGLGLTIAKGIIELMGGTLSVESVPGQGSHFSFALKLNTIQGHKSGILKVNESAHEKPFFKGTALICEDNEMNRIVICEHLERVGLKTVVTVNGKEAVDTVGARMESGEPPFDLIFMDIHMPVMDGLAAAESLMRIGSETPIVALTANVLAENIRLYRSRGMYDYLSKPFKPQELWDCLLRHLTPIGIEAVSPDTDIAESRKLQRKLLENFLSTQQNACKDIEEALCQGNVEYAHRAAHSLKNMAGLLGRGALAQASGDIEKALADGAADDFDNALLERLDKELEAAFSGLAPLLAEMNETGLDEALEPETMNNAQLYGLLLDLKPLLLNNNFESLELAVMLKGIPQAEALMHQIEAYEFGEARKTLEAMMEAIGEP